MNIKNVLFIIIFSAISYLVSYQLYQLGNMPTKKEIANINTIPIFEFESLDGLPFTNIDLPTDNNPIVFMYTDPSCPDCIEMTRKLLKHYTEFENAHLYMVTEADKSLVDLFIMKFNMNRYANIQILLDKNETIYKSFQLFSTPSFIIYGSNLKVIKVIDDKFNFSIVVKYVREANKKKSEEVL